MRCGPPRLAVRTPATCGVDPRDLRVAVRTPEPRDLRRGPLPARLAVCLKSPLIPDGYRRLLRKVKQLLHLVTILTSDYVRLRRRPISRRVWPPSACSRRDGLPEGPARRSGRNQPLKSTRERNTSAIWSEGSQIRPSEGTFSGHRRSHSRRRGSHAAASSTRTSCVQARHMSPQWARHLAPSMACMR